MRFTGKELAAIFRVGHAMADADGKVTEDETNYIVSELASFGVTQDQFEAIIDAGGDLTGTQAMDIISNMDEEQKTYVSAYLGMIMASDGDIDDTELALWRFICTPCDCPDMTLGEAIELLGGD